MRHFLFLLLCLAYRHSPAHAFPGIPAPPMDTIVRLKWVNFSPYTKIGQNPNRNDSIPDAQIVALLDSLRPWVEGIRIFGTQNGLQNIPRLAKERGFKVIVGIWIGKSPAVNAKQIANGIAIAKEGYTDRLIVGSEALLRNEFGAGTADSLIKYIRQVKSACPNIPISCADVYYKLTANPKLLAECSFISPNIYPYWQGEYIECAIQRFHEAYLSVLAVAGGKEIFISESGWKTKPPQVGNAVPSFENAVRYDLELLRWGKRMGVDIGIFEAFDEPWKGNDDGWGIFFSDATMKPRMDTLFKPYLPLDTSLFCQLPPSPGKDTIEVGYVPVIGAYEFIKGRINFVNPCDYKIVMYIKVQGWWIKPTYDQPFIPVSCNRSWSSAYATGGNDGAATEICLFLVPKNYAPPICGGCPTIPAAIYTKAIAWRCISRYILDNAAVSAQKDTICWGDSTVLTAFGGTHYQWSTGDTTAQIKVSPLGYFIYNVTITDGLGGGAILRKPISVLYSSPSIKANKTIVCAGDSVKLTAQGGVAYVWPSGDTTATITTCVFKDSTYQVIVTSEAGCTRIASIRISVDKIEAKIWSSDYVICEGEMASLYANGSYYLWSTGQTTNYLRVFPTETTTYSVIVSNYRRCQDTTSFTVKVLPKPIATAKATPSVVCRGTVVQCSASGGNTYEWSNGKKDSVFAYIADFTRTLTVTVTNGYGCKSTASAVVTVNNLPSASISPSSMTICAGQTRDLSANGGGTYLWSTGATSRSIQVTPLDTTTYTVTVTSANGCTSTASSAIAVITLNPAIWASTIKVCQGDTVVLVATGGDTYRWSTGETNDTIRVSPQSSQAYTVTVTKSNICTKGASILINVINPPNGYVTAAPAKVCKGETTTLRAYNGTSYLWSTGQTTDLIEVTPASTATYTVTIRDGFNCSKVAQVTVSVLEQPDATITALNGLPILGDTVHVCQLAEPQTLTTLDSTGFWYNVANGKFNPKNYAFGTVIKAIHGVLREGCSDYDTLFIKIDCIDKTFEQDLARSCAISPNPFQDKLVISATLSQAEPITAILFNPLGQVVAASTAYPFVPNNGVYEWSGLKHLPEGMYLLTLHVKNKAMATFKVLKR